MPKPVKDTGSKKLTDFFKPAPAPAAPPATAPATTDPSSPMSTPSSSFKLPSAPASALYRATPGPLSSQPSPAKPRVIPSSDGEESSSSSDDGFADPMRAPAPRRRPSAPAAARQALPPAQPEIGRAHV